MKSDRDILKEVKESVQTFEPEFASFAHISDYDSFLDRLNEAEQDYQEACEEYLASNPNKKDELIPACENAERAGKALMSRATVLFYMPSAAEEDKQHAHEILDKVTKDACKRERTVSQLYRATREAAPDMKEMLHKLLKEKQKRMKFLDRCAMTQIHYENKKLTDKNRVDPELEQDRIASIMGARTRACIPEGGRFCPPRIFPHDRIPEGMDVPIAPAPFRRFKYMDPEKLVFNREHYNFELPPDYISEDGLIDSESVVWDYENSKVTMKYRGGVPVTWDFKQYIDLRDVPDPADWCTQYELRLWDQELYEKEPGLLEHRSYEDEVPDYDRIPIPKSEI